MAHCGFSENEAEHVLHRAWSIRHFSLSACDAIEHVGWADEDARVILQHVDMEAKLSAQ
jgi:hypothetical protein